MVSPLLLPGACSLAPWLPFVTPAESEGHTGRLSSQLWTHVRCGGAGGASQSRDKLAPTGPRRLRPGRVAGALPRLPPPGSGSTLYGRSPGAFPGREDRVMRWTGAGNATEGHSSRDSPEKSPHPTQMGDCGLGRAGAQRIGDERETRLVSMAQVGSLTSGPARSWTFTQSVTQSISKHS